MNTPTLSNPIEILIVEDSPTDALLTRRALADAKFFSRVHIAKDGVEAIAFLRNHAPYAAAPRPQLILLDLNMPRMGGREVLAEIKTDDDLRSIPVIVLTSSSAEEDVLSSYKLHANCYITKPVDFDAFAAAVASIENFWFFIATLPPR